MQLPNPLRDQETPGSPAVFSLPDAMIANGRGGARRIRLLITYTI